ncbi:hypothetical protein J4207_03350 [Candidatus Woesearchaeota archaeon]|nr:hypothetical protein [Candidatus Woesearchaeota archaeon]
MAAISVHLAKIREHLQEIKDAIAIGIESRPATIGFHTTSCAIDLLEMYLHKTGKIQTGAQIKHEWFKRPKQWQKIMPLAERHLQVIFPNKNEIFELLYSLEENRNKLIYGSSTKNQIQHICITFEQYKKLVGEMLAEEGEQIEDTNP